MVFSSNEYRGEHADSTERNLVGDACAGLRQYFLAGYGREAYDVTRVVCLSFLDQIEERVAKTEFDEQNRQVLRKLCTLAGMTLEEAARSDAGHPLSPVRDGGEQDGFDTSAYSVLD